MSSLKMTRISKVAVRTSRLKCMGVIVVGLAIALLVGSSPQDARPVKLDQDFADAFGVTDGQVVLLDLDRTPGEPVVVDVTIDGKDYTLDLQPHSLRSNDFVLTVQLADGSYIKTEPDSARTLRGTLAGVQGSRVTGSMMDAGLAAKIVMPDGEVYFLEPLASRLADDHLKDLHVLYHRSDFKPHDGKCGLDDPVVEDENLPAEFQRRRGHDDRRGGGQNDYPQGGSPTIQVAELACDTDVQYFNDYGTVAATLARIELIIDIVNDQYENEVGITHVLTEVIIRTAEPDPYTSNDAGTLLNQFRNHWLNNQQGVQRDLAHLFTGRNLNGGTIGIAWTLGGVCTNEGYCLSESDFNGSLGCATDLTAHELGHLWNANHCSCSSHTMNPFITCANDFHPSFTVPEIINYRNSLDCLDDQVLLGDVNLDGVVNLLDVDPFIALLNSGGYQPEADMNQDGILNLLDVQGFIDALGG